MNLSEVSSLSEDSARKYLESIRWSDGAVCPHCSSKEVTELQGTSTTPGTYKCKSKACRKKFTVRVGTIFEASHITLRHWVMAFHLMCSSKKGMSAHQLHRSLGVTYKTAWFMCHRIRHAMEQEGGLMGGVVEVDETYVGGKPRKPRKGVPTKTSYRGRGTDKAPVAVAIERDGAAMCKPVPDVSAIVMQREVLVKVSPNATLMTDELSAYVKPGLAFSSHKTVCHSAGEYGRMDGELSVHINSAESFFALLKRGHYGTFHKWSKQHLHRYCNEFAFRWTYRKVKDGERTEQAIRGAAGKRLTYK
jgi:transposase-like protein